VEIRLKVVDDVVDFEEVEVASVVELIEIEVVDDEELVEVELMDDVDFVDVEEVDDVKLVKVDVVDDEERVEVNVVDEVELVDVVDDVELDDVKVVLLVLTKLYTVKAKVESRAKHLSAETMALMPLHITSPSTTGPILRFPCSNFTHYCQPFPLPYLMPSLAYTGPGIGFRNSPGVNMEEKTL
jgi:hypothetical protein